MRNWVGARGQTRIVAGLGETSDRVGCGGKDAGGGQGKVRGVKKKTCSGKLEMKLKLR